MQLSIIIVNFNVKYFLEQCLFSVVKAIEGIEAEIIVVDNASADNSVSYLQKLFPRVKFIESKENLGFAKANNLALPIVKGDYILYLNPDTILPEDCLKNCLHFFQTHPNCGALGVQMIDGAGRFLPESKRAFPSLKTAFYKLVGLSLIFPTSSIFNKYALGNLNKDETHDVDVLAGAFMMLPKQVVEKTNGFDEAYFMYGEDIDLSYRVQQLGFKNYYFGNQKIIHFKGESTKRGSLNYVRIFYKAMSIFVTKHYSQQKAKMFVTVINIAIWLRACVSIFQNIIKKLGLPIIDAAIVSLSLYATQWYWIKFLRDGIPFDNDLIQFAIPVFTFVYVIGAFLSGMYDSIVKPLKSFISSISAIIVVLAVYSLLPEDMRFSRGVILFGGIISSIIVTFCRWLFLKNKWFIKPSTDDIFEQSVVVGSLNDYQQIVNILQQRNNADRVLGRIGNKPNEINSIGTFEQLPKLIKELQLKEVIFCEGNVTYKDIIHFLTIPNKLHLNYRFHAKKSNSIVGSDSKASTGETMSIEDFYNIGLPYQQRMKKLIDVWVAIFVIIFSPVMLLFKKNIVQLYKNAFDVLWGNKTWVGYTTTSSKLPKISEGIISPQGFSIKQPYPVVQTVLQKTDKLYAKEYDWLIDLRIIYQHFGNLDA
ncbi:MAG: glycosyltransferase family 2 protein [Chitinophagaceae bacterium]